MNIAYIGLGKMGLHMVERLLSKEYEITAYDPNNDARNKAEELGATTVDSITALMETTAIPRTVWLMVPHQVVGEVLEELKPHLKEGDTIIEGGNSPFKETVARASDFESRGVQFLDAGVSGGPGGAKNGACIMVGGEKSVYDVHEKLFKDLTVQDGYAYVGTSGAGHFTKMVHNGIEYGMMQALAEGFDILRQSDFNIPLTTVAQLYNHGSVIESSLVGWLQTGFEKYGEDLKEITGSASASGEGLWTVETAKEMDIPAVVIEESLHARTTSQKKPNYQGQLISVMRNQFGGHEAEKKNT